jgi:hypothetical protein
MIAVCGFRGVPWPTAEEEQSMNEMFAQGDLLIERVADVEPSGMVMAPDAKASACWQKVNSPVIVTPSMTA